MYITKWSAPQVCLPSNAKGLTSFTLFSYFLNHFLLVTTNLISYLWGFLVLFSLLFWMLCCFLDFMYEWNYMVSLSIWVISLSVILSRFIHVVANSKVSFFLWMSEYSIDFPCGSVVKNPPAMQETLVDPWVGKIPWRRKWQFTSVFFLGKSHLGGGGVWQATVCRVAKSWTLQRHWVWSVPLCMYTGSSLSILSSMDTSVASILVHV